MSTHTHDSFSHHSSHRLPALDLHLHRFDHSTCGTRHYHLAAPGPENVFLVGLHTLPEDDTGVAHILEHTALCGSERYPVRDPFFMMLRRSLNTFMNAFTASDWTAYTFASENRKDFFNLLDVYLDAVFAANLDVLDFRQEGHRVEFTDPGNAASPLQFCGVVYNEMKGSMSSPVSQLWRSLMPHLLPDGTYSNNSGGDPAHIPELTHQGLVDFYHRHYHPSNAVFMTFGDIEPASLQEQFETRVLHRYQRGERVSVAPQPRFSKPQQVRETYPSSDTDTSGKTHQVIAWLLGDSTDAAAMLKTNLLSDLLLGDSAAPLRQLLEHSDLGIAPSPLCGLDGDQREMIFICGLEGSNPDATDAFAELVTAELERLAEVGIDQSRLESALHQLELSQREIGGDGFPFGLQLILCALPATFHGGEVERMLDCEQTLAELGEEIGRPGFCQRMVRELLLDNPHRVHLVMAPDPNLPTAMAEREQQQLQQIRARMSSEQQQDCLSLADTLQQRQSQPQNADALPCLSLSDIPPEIRYTHGERGEAGPLTCTSYTAGTNGLVYADLIAPMPALDDQQRPLLGLYNYLLPQLGAGERDYLQQQLWKSAHTGGLGSRSSIQPLRDDPDRVHGLQVLSASALMRNAEPMAQLLHETLERARFDEPKRIRDCLQRLLAAKTRSIADNGHQLALLAASAALRPLASMGHQQDGLVGLLALRELEQRLQDDQALDSFCEQLQALHRHLWSGECELLLIGREEDIPGCQHAFAEHFPERPGAPLSAFFDLPPVTAGGDSGWLIEAQVNYCARAFPTTAADSEDCAALAVLGPFLRDGYLHRTIREQGGAYGGGAGHDSAQGLFRFFSYRDPRMVETLNDFHLAIDWAMQTPDREQSMTESILSTIGGLDKPRLTPGRGPQLLLRGTARTR